MVSLCYQKTSVILLLEIDHIIILMPIASNGVFPLILCQWMVFVLFTTYYILPWSDGNWLWHWQIFFHSASIRNHAQQSVFDQNSIILCSQTILYYKVYSYILLATQIFKNNELHHARLAGGQINFNFLAHIDYLVSLESSG